jgi:hypothetical protein
MTIGRNDPCHCGSGLKYKKCHLPMEDAVHARPEPDRSVLHDFEHQFTKRVMTWAVERFPDDLDQVGDELPFLAEDAAGMKLLLRVLVFHYPLRGSTLVEWYGSEHEGLSRRDRDWIAAQRASWISIWEVRETVPGKSMILADLLTGEQRLVQEAAGSRDVVIHDAIVGRVIDLGADSILAGIHPQPLPPRLAAEAVEIVRKELGAYVGIARLRYYEATLLLLDVWRELIEREQERGAPILVNGDGDPLLFVVDEYQVRDRDAVVAAIGKLKGATPPHADEDDNVVICFLRPEDTVIGTATIGGAAELRLEANSVRRAFRDVRICSRVGQCFRTPRHASRRKAGDYPSDTDDT